MGSFATGLTPSQLNYAEPAQWRQFIRQALADTRCASPGFLAEDMDAASQTVTVQIAIQERVRPASGPAEWWDVPPIIKVPILVPRGGGYAVTLPLKKGNSGLLIFCDTCFDLWWQNGTSGAPTADNIAATARNAGISAMPSGSQRQFEVRRHYVHDCGFAPGLWSQQDLLPNYSTDSLQIRTDDGTTTVIDVSQAGIAFKGAAISAADGGSAQPLMTEAWALWFTTYVLPHITTGTIPAQPGPTTIFEAE